MRSVDKRLSAQRPARDLSASVGSSLPQPPARVLEHGKRPECVVAREDVVVSDASPKTVLEVLGGLLRGQRLAAELSLRELAARTNISNAYLSELERGLHEPSLRVLRAIASALDIPLGPMLANAGVLDDSEETDRPAGLGVTEAAILRDPALSEPQRVALLSVYRSFVQSRMLG